MTADFGVLFAEKYADVAAWARGMYDDAAEGIDYTMLGAARQGYLAAKGDERRVRRRVYRDAVMDEIRRCCVPACYGVDVEDAGNDGMLWHRRGLYNPLEVAAFLAHTDPVRVDADGGEILASLISANIDFEPGFESDADAVSGGGFDPLLPDTWMDSELLARVVMRPPETGVEAWAVWIKGVWASMLLSYLVESEAI